jgi:hypothetical protein
MPPSLRPLLLCLTLALPYPGRADPVAITEVIGAQIAALLADDFETAFSYASPSIKGMFGSAERFGSMVRQGYPMVHRPDDLRFLETRQAGENIVQRVMIRDTDGRFHLLEYFMIQTVDGWQINGVHILRAPDVGA